MRKLQHLEAQYVYYMWLNEEVGLPHADEGEGKVILYSSARRLLQLILVGTVFRL